MRSAEGAVAQSDADVGDRELATWREEIRRHALLGLARRPVKPPRLLRIGALVLLLLMHAVLLLGLRDAMRRPPAARESVVQVVFLNADLPEPAMPVPTPLQLRLPVAASSPSNAQRVVLPAMPSAPTIAPSATSAPLQLFNADGSIRLPPETPQPTTPQQLSAEIMQRGHNILHCRQTRFANAYTRDESVGDSVARKYLRWIGLYNADFAERKAAERAAEAAAACDG